MHTKILEKCLEELRKEAPRKDYVIGMLETLVEMADGQPAAKTGATTGVVEVLPIPDFPVAQTTVELRADEILTEEDKAYARKMAGGPVGSLKS